MPMNKMMFGLLLCGALMQASATEPQWLTDLPKAQAKAKEEKKMVLLDFTGSDWCGWCKKARKDFLDTPEFSKYAAKNLVLVELDFPSKKIQQSDDLKKANAALKKKFGVDGFPTFVLLDSAGKELGRAEGYVQGGPSAFIAKLESFKK
jgi:protein disulfide-isomerase